MGNDLQRVEQHCERPTDVGPDRRPPVLDTHRDSVLNIYKEYENEALALRSDSAMSWLMGLKDLSDSESPYLDSDFEESHFLVQAGFVTFRGDSPALAERGRHFLSALGIGVTEAHKTDVETTQSVSRVTSELHRRLLTDEQFRKEIREEILHHCRRGTIGRITLDESVIEDISVQALITVFKAIEDGRVREPEELSRLIFRVARRQVIHYIRLSRPPWRRRLRAVRSLTNQEGVRESAPVYDSTLNRPEGVRSEVIRRVISELNEPDKILLLRYYIGEEDAEKIRTDLDLTRPEFEAMLFEARNRFRKLYIKLLQRPPEQVVR